MNYRKIPVGRYLKVMRNPSMTFEELANIMYTDVEEACKRDWVRYTLKEIHERSIYIVHDPIEDCYCNKLVKNYNSDREMEEEMKVKPLTFLGTL